jgi:hypothetical protein
MTGEATIVCIALAEGVTGEGHQMLARFDAVARGFRLNGCMLLRSAQDGAIMVRPSRGAIRRGEPRPVIICDFELRRELAEAAHRAFVALSGA